MLQDILASSHASHPRIISVEPYKDIVLEKKINAVTFGNILLGGIPGWLVDLATNCVSMPQKKHYDITGKPKNKNL